MSPLPRMLLLVVAPPLLVAAAVLMLQLPATSWPGAWPQLLGGGVLCVALAAWALRQPAADGIDVTQAPALAAASAAPAATAMAAPAADGAELAERVRTEKLTSLGSMMAGIAHELSTPIGNAMMVASALSTQQKQFEAQAAAGLRHSVLNEFMATLRETSQVLERNLQRSAELVSSFKQVAVDQASAQRRVFDLAEVVHEIGVALRHTLRQAGVTLVDEVPAGLQLDSLPGPLGQVLINLINNAVVHGFEGRGGSVRVSAAQRPDERLWLQVSDDGQGIRPEHLERVFDPFFTTRPSQGGSGLGLYIAHTLVTGALGGRIEVRSPPGAGTQFEIELPLRAPSASGPGPRLPRGSGAPGTEPMLRQS